MSKALAPVRHFFVDEAGDLTLFDRRGRVLIGEPGSSHTFLVGLCEVPDPVAAHAAMESLRRDLLADPYFSGVPSMQPAAGKTALAFHAKDDVAEVRREMFRLIPSFSPKIIVAIRRKVTLAQFARELHRVSGKKLTPDYVYDDLVEKVCQNQLHKAEENRIVFARRGKSDRNAALTTAIRSAKEKFNRRWRTEHDKPVVVSSGFPSEHAGLQITDYLLWGLQRMIERAEDRYVTALAPHYRLVMDLDDRRHKQYGEWYSDKNIITLEKLKPVAPG